MGSLYTANIAVTTMSKFGAHVCGQVSARRLLPALELDGRVDVRSVLRVNAKPTRLESRR